MAVSVPVTGKQHCVVTLGFGEGTNSLLLGCWGRAGGAFLTVLIKQWAEI